MIWPEGAIPAALEEYLADGAWTRDVIAGALKPGQTLILGGYRFGTAANGAPVTYNSLAVLKPQLLRSEAEALTVEREGEPASPRERVRLRRLRRLPECPAC